MEHNARPLCFQMEIPQNMQQSPCAQPTDEAADSLLLLSCDKEITLRQPNTAVSEANTAVRTGETSRNKIRVSGHQSTELYPHILRAKKYREAVVKSIFKEMIKSVWVTKCRLRLLCVISLTLFMAYLEVSMNNPRCWRNRILLGLGLG